LFKERCIDRSASCFGMSRRETNKIFLNISVYVSMGRDTRQARQETEIRLINVYT